MNEFEVVAQLRQELGKGAMRRLRRTGCIPGVLYGGGKETVSIQFVEHELKKRLENEAFFSHILTVKLDGSATQAVVKALQRDPATDRVTHMDFQRISAEQELHISVPLHFVNEDTCPGRRAGGVATHLLVEVEVGCLPKALPEYLEVDMGEMDVGDSLHLSDLELPDGVRLMTLAHNPDNDQAVVNMQHPQKLEADEEEGEGEELGEEATPEEGAPGAESEERSE